MCGICGKLTTRAAIEPDLIERMCQRIAHRGPDDQGVYIDGPVALGNRRLQILDLSSAGHMPMSNDEGNLWITYNGEVYNFKELRDQLKARGHQFRSGTDTEVVLKAYLEWGVSCVDRFNGMFAFAIWDATKRQLFLARDRMGIKPLYYAFDGTTFLFASETKAMLEDPGLSRQIDPRGIVNYFTFGHAVAPDTIYWRVRKLLPGNYMVCSYAGSNEPLRLEIDQYWSPPVPVGAGGEDLGEDYYAERVYQLLEQSVKRQLVADVPVGVFLSGGIDSSAITAFMSRLSDRPVKTFSIGFTAEGNGYNELDDARRVAQYYETDHHELTLADQDLVSVLDDLVYHYDEPFGDAASFPTHLVSRFARADVPVVISGEGSDELFGGYRRYVAEKYGEYYRKLPHTLTDGVLRGAVGITGRSHKIKKALQVWSNEEPVSRYASWFSLFNDEMRANLLRPGLAEECIGLDSLEVYRRYYPSNGKSSALGKALYVDQRVWLPDTYLEKVDKASMAVSLETRVPFLDHELVEFAATIPAKYKVKGTTTKYILKKALKGVLPEATLKKPKHGFTPPTELWFKGNLKSLIEDVLFDPQARSSAVLNTDYIRHLYQQHCQGNGPYHRHLWLLVVFETWCRKYGVTF